MSNDRNGKQNQGAGNRRLKEIDLALLRETEHSCNPEECEKILAQGADANARGEDGCGPLIWAVLSGNMQAVQLLIRSGADVNGRNDDGETPLHLAAMTGVLEIAKLLVASGADVNAQDEFGITPFRSADLNEDRAMVEFLREKGGKE